ncbi:MAG: hypothetical protein ACRC9X_06385 [Bacteroidales bacterium]
MGADTFEDDDLFFVAYTKEEAERLLRGVSSILTRLEVEKKAKPKLTEREAQDAYAVLCLQEELEEFLEE